MPRRFTREPLRRLPKRLAQALTFVLYALMLGAILALWNDDAPQFIYVAF